jgi:lysophospholipase L1-like esterase
LVIEICGQVAWRLKFGEWYFAQFYSAFIPHPYLVGVPKPSYRTQRPSKLMAHRQILVAHNSLGYRGHEISQDKPQGIKRVCTLGGSTTYCVGTSNDETWPAVLEILLGRGWDVINMGVPGYTTVEYIIQTALDFSDLRPDYAVYYLGWNDIRNMHIKNLKSDYSDFHGKSQYTNLSLGYFSPYKWSLICLVADHAFKKFRFFKYDIDIKATDKAFTAEADPRALNLYKRNVLSIIALCKEQKVVPILVPQVLNYERTTSKYFATWVPFVKDQDLKTVIDIYNQALQEIAAAEHVGFVGAVLTEKFAASDFLDKGHFSPSGNKKFSLILKNYLLAPLPSPQP